MKIQKCKDFFLCDLKSFICVCSWAPGLLGELFSMEEVEEYFLTSLTASIREKEKTLLLAFMNIKLLKWEAGLE